MIITIVSNHKIVSNATYRKEKGLSIWFLKSLTITTLKFNLFHLKSVKVPTRVNRFQTYFCLKASLLMHSNQYLFDSNLKVLIHWKSILFKFLHWIFCLTWILSQGCWTWINFEISKILAVAINQSKLTKLSRVKNVH